MNARENLLRVLRHEDPEWVPNGLEATVWLAPPVVERPAGAGRDAWGVLHALEEKAEGGTYPAPGGYVVSDLSRWREEVVIPEVEALDWSEVGRRGGEVDRQAFLLVGFVEFGLFERAYMLLGMENALTAFLTEPQEMYELVGAIADYKIKLLERFDDVADLDMVWFGDDWGTQDDLFIPPETWRTCIKPHLARVYDCMHRRNILINQHSCGRIERIFGDMVELGADIYNPCQPCNDLALLKREYGGRITFCGGIDSQHVLDRPGVTPEEVRSEVRGRIREMGARGGYIAAPSHDVPYDAVLLAAMDDEISVFGRAFYSGSTAGR